MFLEQLILKNYKCFPDESISFNVPNGNEGSGLNIFIGENGTGKTTILEAINYLTQNTYSSENKLKIHDFNKYEENIHITGIFNEFKYKMPYPKNYFECKGFEFIAKNRDRKAPGKLLSSPIQINNYVLNIHQNYKNSKHEDSGKEITNYYRTFNNSNIQDDEINIFYFDKNRTRQITMGNYKTTFEKICLDLNWKFTKNITEENHEKLVENISGEYFKNVIEIAQKGIGEKLAKDLKDFFDNDEFRNLKIELLDILNPFNKAFFAIRKENELNQIETKDLGSGIEIILTLLLLKSIANESKGTVVYLIDEPELHLHPKAQYKLISLLLEESRDKQIFLSTHSPYIFKNCLMDGVGLFILQKNRTNNIGILNAREENWGLFPWSPSWGEINYFAYNLLTVEFHNELYGYLQTQQEKFSENEIEGFFVQNSIPKSKRWIKIFRGESQEPYDITLCSYIRNSIHHPENEENDKYTDEELNASITLMINIIEN